MGTPYLPPAAFYFKVQLQGDSAKNDAAFREASGISVELQTETYAEGGVNDSEHRLPTYPRYSNLVLKRGLVVQSLPLFQWCQKTIQSNYASPIVPKTVVVTLLNATTDGPTPANGAPLRTWTLYGAWPTKWAISALESQRNDVVVETLEFAYDHFTVS